jgi:hypothetical protein
MNIAHLLNQTVTIQQQSGYDNDGRESVGAATTHRARFQQTNKTVLLPTGDSITLDGYVDVLGTASVDNNDRLTYNGDIYRVITRKENVDKAGNVNHITLGVKQWQT